MVSEPLRGRLVLGNFRFRGRIHVLEPEGFVVGLVLHRHLGQLLLEPLDSQIVPFVQLAMPVSELLAAPNCSFELLSRARRRIRLLWREAGEGRSARSPLLRRWSDVKGSSKLAQCRLKRLARVPFGGEIWLVKGEEDTDRFRKSLAVGVDPRRDLPALLGAQVLDRTRLQRTLSDQMQDLLSSYTYSMAVRSRGSRTAISWVSSAP